MMIVTKEIWKNVLGYEGLYQVSNLGNIKSFIGKEKILKPSTTNNGYPGVNLTKDKKIKRYSVHRLVAEAFIPNPNNYPCVNHKDENRTNNRADNLEWCTYSYNNTYGSIQKKKLDSYRGFKHSKESLEKMQNIHAEKEGKKIKCLTTNEVFKSIGEASRKYDIKGKSNISECCIGKRKSAGKLPNGTKLKWEYWEE